MSWPQLQMWHAYSMEEPFGSEATNYHRSGIIASIIANVNRGKNSRVSKPTDFMPKRYQPKKTTQKPLTSRSKWESVKAMARSMAGG